jgi:transcriptional regulator with XRE-family HTH domain
MKKEQIGGYIASRRQFLNLKQEDLSQMAGVTTKTIYQIESGKGNPSLETLEKLLDVLGLTLSLNIKTVTE